MDQREIRMRCIEAAARNPYPHKDGVVAAVLEAAKNFEGFVDRASDYSPDHPRNQGTLGLPKKRV